MEVRVERDLVFARHDGSELTLDVYRAPHDDAPVTVYVHGGGWRGGDKTDVGADLGHSSAVQAVVHWFGQSDLIASGSRTDVETRFELLGGAGHEGAEFDHPASLALTAAWLRALLCKPLA